MSSKDGSQISKETGSSKDGSKKGGSSTSSSMAEVRSGGDTGGYTGQGIICTVTVHNSLILVELQFVYLYHYLWSGGSLMEYNSISFLAQLTYVALWVKVTLCDCVVADRILHTY